MKPWVKRLTMSMVSRSMSDVLTPRGAGTLACRVGTRADARLCEFLDLGLMSYAEALSMQKNLAEQRKRGEIPDHLLIVEHPHVITLGRNGHLDNLLASPEVLARTGISFHHTDRGGDITYHGPGQIVGYPIFDLREWKRDVVAYVRTVEQAIMDTLFDFDIPSDRIPGC